MVQLVGSLRTNILLGCTLNSVVGPDNVYQTDYREEMDSPEFVEAIELFAEAYGR